MNNKMKLVQIKMPKRWVDFLNDMKSTGLIASKSNAMRSAFMEKYAAKFEKYMRAQTSPERKSAPKPTSQDEFLIKKHWDFFKTLSPIMTFSKSNLNNYVMYAMNESLNDTHEDILNDVNNLTCYEFDDENNNYTPIMRLESMWRRIQESEQSAAHIV